MDKDYLPDVEDYLERLKDVYDKLDRNQINKVMNALMDAYEAGKNIFIFGNGGSSATASHYVCDFNKGVSICLDKKFRFTCLNDNVPSIMAIANDCGFEKIFRMQLESHMEDGDYVFAISGSGNSKNVIEAVEYAKSRGGKVISLTGYSGGKLLPLADYPIHVNVDNMQLAEDVHMMVCHLIASILARKFGHPMC